MRVGNTWNVTKDDINFQDLLKKTASALPRLTLDTCPDTEWEHCSELDYMFEGESSDSTAALVYHDISSISIELLASDSELLLKFNTASNCSDRVDYV
jgi:hypothetical protein